jgi:hypothetical protein
MEERQAIFVPMTEKLAFKAKSAELGRKLGRTITQVELVRVIGETSTKKLLELFK